ncbi:hypothetical protein [Taibaiella sp. KBW10]|uniref:chryseobasin-related MNIO class RiPP peptide n=1 Tax=Taibaiella sp. KBW10 TaxID=2153357 RepID=UPI00131553F8|nr:hypothetical protein [Taibaiella sp. KBW10]
MKISKKLIGAIVVGIAIQVSTTSCNKKEIKPQKAPNAENGQPVNHDPVLDCPACGMG